MIGFSKAPSLESPALPREMRAGIDECRLVFCAIDAASSPGVMIDVGAHFGGALAPFAKAGWQVLAFEPDADNRAKLAETMRADPDGFAGVEVFDVAVSDEIAEGVAFFASEESTGISGLSAFHKTHKEVASVHTTTLNHVLHTHNLTNVDFLKIDVEGHEMSVLRGLDFTQVTPRAIVAEFEDRKTAQMGFVASDLAAFLSDKGYTVFVSEWHPIERYGIRHSWRRMTRWPCDIPKDSWGNFIAFQQPPDDAALNASVRYAFTTPGLRSRIKRLASKFGRRD